MYVCIYIYIHTHTHMVTPLYHLVLIYAYVYSNISILSLVSSNTYNRAAKHLASKSAADFRPTKYRFMY